MTQVAPGNSPCTPGIAPHAAFVQHHGANLRDIEPQPHPEREQQKMTNAANVEKDAYLVGNGAVANFVSGLGKSLVDSSRQ